jgi:DnaJ-class molecular chaperone|tara:strand:- start:55 stop:216 length:162 start_codon:yes stop_codon:yes gene_type:complete
METITDAKLTLKTETCPLCHGWGELEGYAGVNKMTCFKCKGTGREKIYQLTAQ